MRVDKIALTGFRNYEWEAAEFSPGINVISGPNAQGKTNLLESIYILSAGRSFRTRFDRELVGFDYSSAEILSDLVAFGRDYTVKIQLAPGQRKQITVNSVRKNATELSEIMSCVLFSPDDLEIIKDGSAGRRRFMDMAISQLRPGYAQIISEYSRLHDQKSAILKDWREKPSLLDTLDDFSNRMCRVSAKIIRYRATFTAKLEGFAKEIQRDFSAGADTLGMAYKTVSTVENPFGSEKEIYYAVSAHQEAHRKAELESGQCLTGAHKDDIEISINGRSARAFASQGQTRTAALSMKLAEREVHLDDSGEPPVLLLDDVLSELDAKRQEFVLNRIGGGQTFITCCDGEDIKRRTGGRVYRVENGRIKGL